MKNIPDLIVILGPTASGKTRLAAKLAHGIEGEIISADSRQVYRGMDIGTGKDLDDYILEGIKIPFHLIDICEAGEKYNVARFQSDFFRVFDAIKERGKKAILCGGTGLYIQSVLQNFGQVQVPVNEVLREKLCLLDKEELKRYYEALDPVLDIDTSTAKRLIRGIEMEKYLKANGRLPEPHHSGVDRYCIFGLNPAADLRRERISRRLKQRLEEQDLVGEVKFLLESGISSETLLYYGLEYKYITEFLTGKRTREEMLGRLETEIHRYAKRQMTFFRSMEKKGFQIKWLDSDPERAFGQLLSHLEQTG